MDTDDRITPTTPLACRVASGWHRDASRWAAGGSIAAVDGRSLWSQILTHLNRNRSLVAVRTTTFPAPVGCHVSASALHPTPSPTPSPPPPIASVHSRAPRSRALVISRSWSIANFHDDDQLTERASDLTHCPCTFLPGSRMRRNHREGSMATSFGRQSRRPPCHAVRHIPRTAVRLV